MQPKMTDIEVRLDNHRLMVWQRLLNRNTVRKVFLSVKNAILSIKIVDCFE
jgi:hypothetical protein